jgi:CheY-like chemotaxis protein
VSCKLLLADDSVTSQRVIALTFAAEDVQIVSVTDGEEAIQRIPLEKPDIVLADIGTPGRSGYEIAAFVKQHPQLSHVPVLLLAGAFESVDEARARVVRSDGILVKPFEPKQVVARVLELVEARRPKPQTFQLPALGPESRLGRREFLPSPPEPRVPGPEPAATSLDDYFDRLDAAFAARGPGRPAPPAEPAAGRDDHAAGTRVPTIEDVLSGASLRSSVEAPGHGRVAPPPPEPPDASPTLTPAPAPPAQSSTPPVRGNAIANAFGLILAVEQGELDPAAARIGPISGVEITDELVERVTSRVLQKLAPETARNLVAEIVSDVAERLVREEIERIRKA